MKILCEAYIPIRLPFPVEGLDRLTNGSIRQLLRLSGILLNPDRPIPVAITRPKKAELERLSIFLPRHRFRKYTVLKISAEVPFINSEWTIDSKEGDSAFSEGFFASIIAGEFGFLSHQLVLTANIARPGSICTEQGPVFFDGRFYHNISGLTSSLDLLFFHGRKPCWPGLEMLKLEKVWRWLCELEDFHEGFGSSPLGKALAAFTYMFSHDFGSETPLDDLHVIMALEAIYNSNGSQRDLVERSQLFLGRPPRGKSPIYDLYKTRSAIIHGGASLPFLFCERDGTPEYERFHQRKMEFWDYSLPLLLATFQRMAKERIWAIEFEVRLKKSEPQNAKK